jgi:hypothetical protein
MEDRTKPPQYPPLPPIQYKWVVLVKDRLDSPERNFGSYDTEEEARRVAAKLESDKTYYRVILNKALNIGSQS